MSDNYYYNKEYENIQKTKIAIFCSAIGDNNIERAERYLTQANWNEQIALQNFVLAHQKQIPDIFRQNDFSSQSHSNLNNINISKLSVNKEKDNKKENIKDNKIYYYQFHIRDTIIKNSYNCLPNSEYFNYISQNLKLFQRDFNTFMKSLKGCGGVIIIFNDSSYNRLKEQIKKINEQSFIKEIIKNFVIFPVLKSTNLGREFTQNLTIISFPTYIFCKYKDENNLYITDKMEGAFEISFFVDCLLKDSQPEKNAKELEDNAKQNKNQEKMDIENYNNFNDYIGNENNFGFENNIRNRDNKNNENSHKYKDNYNKNDNNSKYNKNNNLYHDFENDENLNYYDENEYNHNNNYKINKIDYNRNIFDEDEVFIEPSHNKKNDDNNRINSYNNKNSIDKKNNILADSIYQLSDGQILEKREKEMRELERQQEEKEKKEEEEKKKKIEEENILKNNNKKYEDEANFAKMFLSEEPKGNDNNICHIIFRFPDGEKSIERKFYKTDKVAILYDYIKSIGREIFTEPDSTDFDILCLCFPPKNLEDSKNRTLEEEKLFPNSVLQIKEK